jgi:hypothetical protein
VAISDLDDAAQSFQRHALEKVADQGYRYHRFYRNKLVWSMPRKTAVNICLDKLYFVARSAFHMSDERKARILCDGHDLGAFAALCFADSKTPFFAGAKLSSMNASRISIWPRSYRSFASSWAMRWKAPEPIDGTADDTSGAVENAVADLSRGTSL